MMPALGPTLPRPTTAPPAGAAPPPSGADAFALVLSGAVSQAAPTPDAEAPATPPADATDEGGAGEGLPSLVAAGNDVVVALPAPPATVEGGVVAPAPESPVVALSAGSAPPDAARQGGVGEGAREGVLLGSEAPQRGVSTVSAPGGGVAESLAAGPSASFDEPNQATRGGGAEGAEPVRQEPGRPSDLPPARGSTPLAVEAVPTAGGAVSPASDSPRPATPEQAETPKTGRGGSAPDRPSYATTSPVTAPPAEHVEAPPRPSARPARPPRPGRRPQVTLRLDRR